MFDADFLQHLSNDHFDVLIVDFNALEAINSLNFINEVFLDFTRPQNI